MTSVRRPVRTGRRIDRRVLEPLVRRFVRRRRAVRLVGNEARRLGIIALVLIGVAVESVRCASEESQRRCGCQTGSVPLQVAAGARMRPVNVPLHGIDGPKLLTANETLGGRATGAHLVTLTVDLKLSRRLKRQAARRAAELVAGYRVRLAVMRLNAGRRAKVLPAVAVPARVTGTGRCLRQFQVAEFGLMGIQGVNGRKRLRTGVTQTIGFRRRITIRDSRAIFGICNE